MGCYQSKNVIYQVSVSEPRQGETAIYRSPKALEQLLLSPDDKCFTMQDILLQSLKQFGPLPFLGTIDKQTFNKYNWKTYNQTKDMIEKLGTNINRKKLYTVANDFENFKMNLVGIFSKNREEWLVLEYANCLYRKTMVPLYDTLGPESIQYILEQTELESLFIDQDAVDSLIKTNQLENLKNVILFDEISEDKNKKLQEKGLTIIKFKDLLQLEGAPDQYEKVSPDDIFTFSYTSGTTGFPKGAMISHKNIVSVIAVCTEEKMDTNDVYYSYLPLPHVFERLSICYFLFIGGRIGFYRGDVKKLKEDLAIVKPTVFVAVPRVLNKFFDAINAQFSQAQGLKGKLLQKALQTKIYWSKNGYYTHKFWDKLIFNKVKNALGGNVKFSLCGGAPISSEVLTFLRGTLCMPINEGYGQTEGTGAQFSTYKDDGETGHVGGIRGHLEMKLIDIPEMRYTSKDLDQDGNPCPRGEICVRGNSIFCGYYKQKDKTMEAIDKDGWLHSGDVGRINFKTKSLTIIDRKKNIFKLSQGEYIAPEKIENVYLRAQGVEECFVYGDSLQSVLIAIVHPTLEYLKQLADEKGYTYDPEQLCKNKEIIKIIKDNMIQLGKQEGLFGFEQAKGLYLFHKSFSEINCLTNTMKLKRKECKDYFKQFIDEFYAEENKKQQEQQK
ncbi:hypothetical protein IMG5_021020 [Ichthyophthirius multifiliis]|uniref:AMP-dependent synthetase/ligase domain-containing protein n=1 Tax=Ichthyophthirius multifiliis TaxID=5932 RepID=G0QKR5_ICHMU|nr:hypothetical protein IMG5_021020 [Ichthyophthirius multifiliis]EGR34187.1 hypothetical protein IMG5_021020 [Ichthyophthirius multifiliis]|eukprot:XP_004039491.1 hypothetical protein IMG5_021020 [Ichthyophthirius multifiliis]